jgi:phospholipase C
VPTPPSNTVGAGRRLSAQWSLSGAYDFTVHGPNGFLRRFAGSGPGVEVTARPAGDSGDLALVLTNSGTASVRVTVAGADGYGQDRPADYALLPGARVVHSVHTAASAGWYDLSVTAGPLVRRLAGHVETGCITLTDPGLGAR